MTRFLTGVLTGFGLAMLVAQLRGLNVRPWRPGKSDDPGCTSPGVHRVIVTDIGIAVEHPADSVTPPGWNVCRLTSAKIRKIVDLPPGEYRFWRAEGDHLWRWAEAA